MSAVLENAIYVSDKAKEKVQKLMQDAGISADSSFFLRVGVVGGGCSGLSYKLDFDNERKPTDQEFEDNGVKVVTDFISVTPTQAVHAAVEKVSRCSSAKAKRYYKRGPGKQRPLLLYWAC